MQKTSRDAERLLKTCVVFFHRQFTGTKEKMALIDRSAGEAAGKGASPPLQSSGCSRSCEDMQKTQQDMKNPRARWASSSQRWLCLLVLLERNASEATRG